MDHRTADPQVPKPGGFRLPADTRLGKVTLQVADLHRSLAFYGAVLGMRSVTSPGRRAELLPQGGDRVLVELVERPGARAASRRGRLGLYHYAILLPDRASLGRFARHLEATGIRAGGGDHLVSEALYLSDPDGLGIEVYADRPRAEWRWRGREVVMRTDPLDLEGLRAATGEQPWTGMPAGACIGHVHLHVGDLDAAASFFSETLGFDRTNWSYPGALFFGAGGYHHHVGVNTWAGGGARPPEDDDARLLEWAIEMPDAVAISMRDPSGAQVRIVPAGSRGAEG